MALRSVQLLMMNESGLCACSVVYNDFRWNSVELCAC